MILACFSNKKRKEEKRNKREFHNVNKTKRAIQ